MMAIAAALPIVVALVLFPARAKAITMALWSLASGLAVALVFFPVGLEKWLGAGVLFGPTVLEVLLILFGGVLLSRVTTETSNRRLISAMTGCATERLALSECTSPNNRSNSIHPNHMDTSCAAKHGLAARTARGSGFGGVPRRVRWPQWPPPAPGPTV